MTVNFLSLSPKAVGLLTPLDVCEFVASQIVPVKKFIANFGLIGRVLSVLLRQFILQILLSVEFDVSFLIKSIHMMHFWIISTA